MKKSNNAMKTLFCSALACTLASAEPAQPTVCLAAPNHLILSRANQNTANDFYQQLATSKGNVFFSPYSVSSALAMVSSGARGETEAEMRKVLHFELPQQNIPNAFRDLNAAILTSAGKDGPKLHIANALCQTGGTVNPDYHQLIKDAYGAEVFKGDLAAINTWVKKQTEGKIEKILDQLSANSACVLLNAIYFKGAWQLPFDKELTAKAPFHLADGTKAIVPMMRNEKHYRLLTTPGARLLEIPYKGNTMSMVILLPDAIDGLPALEKQCTADNLNTWLKELQSAESPNTRLSLPKFKLETSYDLIPTCKALGMTRPFAFETADFSGMLGKPGDLCIAQIKHKAVLEVNETGTEAAAATAVEMALRSMPRKPVEFNADHPFLFLIREHSTNSILFMGRMSNPEG